jgi:LuxR family transcriptional regulator, maltose regulon positive regulatory protein
MTKNKTTKRKPGGRQRPSFIPSAKIAVPRLGTTHPRERVFSLLDRGDDISLIWVSGPAGSGKTTAVAGHLIARHRPHVWYQLDARDLEPAAFFYYLRAALQNAAGGRRVRLPLFTPEYAFGLPAFARNFFELAARALAPAAVLVFDDWQEAGGAEWLTQCLLVATEALPAAMQIVVISREEPPPALTPLRARHAMARIGWEELRLQPPETRAIVQLLGAPGTAADRLHEASGGWVSGLVLMLADPGADRSAGGGVADAADPQLAFDYFAAEVFGKTDPETREFLLKTVPLPYMEAETAATLSGNARAGQVLAELARQNYFTFRRGARSFQHHPLFRQFLLIQARARFTEAEWITLQRRAAGILAAHELIDEAAALMQAAGDHAGLAKLLIRHAAGLARAGRLQVLAQWLAALPPPMLVDAPWLSYWAGIASLPFRPRDSLAYFDRAFTGFEAQADTAGAYLACAGALEAVFNSMSDLRLGDPWIERLDALMRRHAPPSPEIDAQVTANVLLLLTWHRPSAEPMRGWAARARKLWRSIKDIDLRVRLGYVLVYHYDWNGNLAAAKSLLDTLRELAAQRDVLPLSRITTRYVEGHHRYMCADNAGGVEAVQDGFAVAEQSGVHVLDPTLLADSVYLAFDRNDLAQADQFLARMAAIMARIGRPGDYAHFHALAGWRALLDGNWARAQEEARTAVEATVEAGMVFPEALCRYALAVALDARGEPDAAELQLDRLQEITAQSGSTFLEFMHCLGRAQCTLDRNEPGGAEWLRRAMAIGRRQGLMQAFWWHPPTMARLCAAALERGIEPDYVRALVAHRRLLPPPGPIALEHWPFPVKVRTLGHFAVEVQDRPLRFSGKSQSKPLDLLKALIAFGGRDVSMEKLAGALWPDADGDAAYRSLVTTLHRLRKLLGGQDVVTAHDGKLTLDGRRCWVDVWALEQLLGEAERGTVAGEALEPLAERLLAAYPGAFLADETEAPWLLGYRERLRGRVLRMLESLARLAGGAGRCELSMRLCHRALEVDDLMESCYQNLLRCYLARGRRAEAQALYRRCCSVLGTVGLKPSVATEALAGMIVDDAPGASVGLCGPCREKR